MMRPTFLFSFLFTIFFISTIFIHIIPSSAYCAIDIEDKILLCILWSCVNSSIIRSIQTKKRIKAQYSPFLCVCERMSVNVLFLNWIESNLWRYKANSTFFDVIKLIRTRSIKIKKYAMHVCLSVCLSLSLCMCLLWWENWKRLHKEINCRLHYIYIWFMGRNLCRKQKEVSFSFWIRQTVILTRITKKMKFLNAYRDVKYQNNFVGVCFFFAMNPHFYIINKNLHNFFSLSLSPECKILLKMVECLLFTFSRNTNNFDSQISFVFRAFAHTNRDEIDKQTHQMPTSINIWNVDGTNTSKYYYI